MHSNNILVIKKLKKYFDILKSFMQIDFKILNSKIYYGNLAEISTK